MIANGKQCSNPVYVYMIPFTVRKQLAAILDPEQSWESLALLMTDIGNEDLQACRNALPFDSPTEILLAIWGSKGNKIIQLYNYLARAKLVRAMKVLRHFVDGHYHCWEYECLQSGNSNRTNDSASSSKDSDSVGKPLALTHNLNWLHQQNHESTESRMMYLLLQNTPCIKYDEIIQITNNFSPDSILGVGGYGTVYKAMWEKTQVAVKRIQSTKEYPTEREQLRQSLQELKTLSKYRHDNILPLYAYSLDGPEPCLLYQYMANGSLFDCLFKKKNIVLSWLERFSIALGCARGLHYLHSVANEPIIHGDVKSANILLDKYFEPKLGDFGLCRSSYSQAECGADRFFIASHVKGTLAYLPEEFLTERIVSTKLDVYGYGVVLLEIATGLKAYVVGRDPASIVEYVLGHKERLKDAQELEAVLSDRHCSFHNDLDTNNFKLILQIGLGCIMHDHLKRPTFREIIDTLLNTGNKAFL